jgi:hypothetical protein
MNYLNLSCVRLIGGMLVFAAGCLPSMANPREDLASPDSVTRAAAATTLQKTYVPVAGTVWSPLISKLKSGLPVTAVDDILRPYHPTPLGGAGGGGGSTQSYRLDDDWILILNIDDWAKPKKLMSATIERDFQQIWAQPPKDYSGLWINYFVNGQKSQEIQYRNGVYFGEFISYRSDGSRALVLHYDETGCNGDSTCYYATGEVEYRAHYSHGKEDGIWHWYSKDGTVTSTQDHTK